MSIPVKFEGRGDRWVGAAEKAERGERDKHQPWSVELRSDSGELVDGVMLVTALAEEKAGERDAEVLLSEAFGKALVAELGLRPLRAGFRFVIDHRWILGY